MVRLDEGLWHDRGGEDVEVVEQRGERLLQGDLDGRLVDGLDFVDDAEQERVSGALGIEDSLEREDDVVDRHRAAVVEHHALPNGERVDGPVVGDLPAFRDRRATPLESSLTVVS